MIAVFSQVASERRQKGMHSVASPLKDEVQQRMLWRACGHANIIGNHQLAGTWLLNRFVGVWTFGQQTILAVDVWATQRLKIQGWLTMVVCWCRRRTCICMLKLVTHMIYYWKVRGLHHPSGLSSKHLVTGVCVLLLLSWSTCGQYVSTAPGNAGFCIWNGDIVSNTTEENSSVFSLIQV